MSSKCCLLSATCILQLEYYTWTSKVMNGGYLGMVTMVTLLIGKNIVVCNGGYRVKLIDFGTACNVESAAPQNNGWTPVFAAPEVGYHSNSLCII